MNFLIMFDTPWFSFSFCIFFLSDLFKIMIYSVLCKTKIQISLFLKWSAFFNTITSVPSNFKIKIRADTSHSALSGDLLSLFLVSGNLLLIVNHNQFLLVFQRDLQVLSPFCLATHFPFAGFFLIIHIKIQSMHRAKSWSFNLGRKLVLDPSQLTLEVI